jgi:hypothetical protein
MRIPRRLANLYPPFLGAGIKVDVSPDFRRITAQLKWRWWNRNYVGTQFGGSVYMMTDPFYMVMLIERLGTGYTVWLAEATVRYLKPGRSALTAEFELSDAQVESLRREVDAAGITTAVFRVPVHDVSGAVVAEVVQTLHLRARRFVRARDHAEASTVEVGAAAPASANGARPEPAPARAGEDGSR